MLRVFKKTGSGEKIWIARLYKESKNYLTLSKSCPMDWGHFINKNLNKQKMNKNNNEQVAILSIEFQKSWTDKGFFNRLIKKELKRKNVINNTINLLDFARQSKIKIVHAPLLIDKKDKNYKKMPFPAKLFGQLTKGTWKAEFTEGIYKQSDIVAVGRYGFDATKGSNLK